MTDALYFYFLNSNFFLSWVLFLKLPLAYTDLTMWIPGGMAIVLTLFSKDSFRSLLKIGPLGDIGLGLGLTFLSFIFFLILCLSFSQVSFGLPEEALTYHKGNSWQAWVRFLILGFPPLIFMNVLFALGEEIGWRGYLLKKIGLYIPHFWVRSLSVGFIWGTWHIPLCLHLGFPLANILIFVMNVCLISIIYARLFERHFSI